MTPSRQVRRAQERAAAKASVREEKAAARQAAVGLEMSIFQADITQMLEKMDIIRQTPEERRETERERREAERLRNVEREEAWRNRVLRQGPVPIESVSFDGQDDQYLIAPSRPGNTLGTIRIRIFGAVARSIWLGKARRDFGRFEVPMTPKGPVEPGTAEALWFKLSAHRRLAMLAAVAHRQIPPKYQPQEADHG